MIIINYGDYIFVEAVIDGKIIQREYRGKTERQAERLFNDEFGALINKKI